MCNTKDWLFNNETGAILNDRRTNRKRGETRATLTTHQAASARTDPQDMSNVRSSSGRIPQVINMFIRYSENRFQGIIF